MDDRTLTIRRADTQLLRPPQRYAATLVFHPDVRCIGASVVLPAPGDVLEISRYSPDFFHPGSDRAVLVADPYVSRKPVLLCPESAGLRLQIHPEGSLVTLEQEDLEGFRLIPWEHLKRGVLLTLARRVLILLHEQSQQVEDVNGLGMIGRSDGVELARQAIRRVADLPVPVLIRGETGTGKELVAAALHGLSPRRDRHMVAINVGAIPESLVVAELFGARKGAYTGANRDKPGYFLEANGSTLFLDEIGDASDEVQLALLRALEVGEIQPVGGSERIAIDVRLLAATDADIDKKISHEQFRSPLLQRLAGYEIWLPPLRERRVDIAILLRVFLDREMARIGTPNLFDVDNADHVAFWRKVFSGALQHPWPGNIRQLRNLAQQLVIHNRDGGELTLPGHWQSLVVPAQAHPENLSRVTGVTDDFDQDCIDAADTPARRKPSEITEAELVLALAEQRYDLKNTAESLGISRAALYKMIESNPDIRKAGDLSLQEIGDSFSRFGGDLEQMVDHLKVSRAALKRRIKEMQLR